MKYLLFGYWTYYPSGGMNDLIGSFDTIDECKARAEQEDYYSGEFQIVQDLKIIWIGKTENGEVEWKLQ